MIKILHIIATLEPAGAETLLKDLAIFSKKLDQDVTILIIKKTNSHLIDILQAENVKLVFLPGKHCYSPLNIIRIWQHIKTYDYDLIHTHLTPAQIPLALINMFHKHKLPLITTEHNTFNRRRKSVLFKLFDTWLYKQYQKIICITPATAAALIQWVPNCKNKCIVIYNGIDVDQFCQPCAPTAHNTKTFVICVGRLEEQKNQQMLIRALPKLNNVHLQLVGEGQLKNELITLSKELNVYDKISFLGKRADIKTLLYQADIYVQPSAWEGFGIAAVEAMAAGLPIITSDVPGLREIVADAGFKFPLDDIEKLVELITILQADLDLRRQMSIKAKARAQQFSVAETAQKYNALYLKICKEAVEF